jgi:hypothetical protein
VALGDLHVSVGVQVAAIASSRGIDVGGADASTLPASEATCLALRRWGRQDPDDRGPVLSSYGISTAAGCGR